MDYTDENRGKITNPRRKMQLIDYSKLRYGNGTPTDIDGFMELEDKGFAFFEYKLEGTQMPEGQKKALTRLVNALASGTPKEAILFECFHNAKDPNKDIDGANSIVGRYFYEGGWFNGGGRTVKQIADKFFSNAKGEKQEEPPKKKEE